MIISVNTLHFIPVPIDIYFFTFVKQTLLQQMRKWICEKLPAQVGCSSFRFRSSQVSAPGAGARSQTHSPEMMPAQSETRVLEPSHGLWAGRGAKSSWGNDEMRWGRPAEYGIQLAVVSPLHVFPSQPLGSSLAQLRTRFRPRASLLRVTENNAKFRVLNLANVHRKLLSI